jgi:hypothetical protein
MQTLRAGTDMAAGQELTISYINMAIAEQQQRQLILYRSFNFECKCEVITP